MNIAQRASYPLLVIMMLICKFQLNQYSFIPFGWNNCHFTLHEKTWINLNCNGIWNIKSIKHDHHSPFILLKKWFIEYKNNNSNINSSLETKWNIRASRLRDIETSRTDHNKCIFSRNRIKEKWQKLSENFYCSSLCIFLVYWMAFFVFFIEIMGWCVNHFGLSDTHEEQQQQQQKNCAFMCWFINIIHLVGPLAFTMRQLK